jgi:glycerol kinase
MAELKENWSLDKTWQPEMSEEQRKKDVKNWRKAVDRTLNWID